MNSSFKSPLTSYNVAIFLAAIAAIVALAIVVNAAPVLVNRDDNGDCNIAEGHSCTPNPGKWCNQFLYFSPYLGRRFDFVNMPPLHCSSTMVLERFHLGEGGNSLQWRVFGSFFS
jgi:hypothetical protein